MEQLMASRIMENKRIPENPNSELISGEITEPIKYVNNRVQISQELSLFD